MAARTGDVGMNESQQVNLPDVDGVVPVRLKRAVMSAGLVLLILGMPAAINLFCIVPLVVLNGLGFNGVTYGVVSLTVALLTLGVGTVTFLHANRSLQNKPSKLLQLPFPLLLVGVFIFLLGLGSVILAFDVAAGLFFPPILIIGASDPEGRQSQDDQECQCCSRRRESEYIDLSR